MVGAAERGRCKGREIPDENIYALVYRDEAGMRKGQETTGVDTLDSLERSKGGSMILAKKWEGIGEKGERKSSRLETKKRDEEERKDWTCESCLEVGQKLTSCDRCEKWTCDGCSD